MITLTIIIGLALLILGHEAGHFFGAKWLKMKVEEFGIGFPPRIAARTKGDTEYSVNWLPFGGFVRIAGENDRMIEGVKKLESLPAEERKKLFYFRPAWQRSIVILAGVLMNFVIGWILFSFIFAIGTPHVVVIGRVQPESPAALAGFEEGDVVKGYESAQRFIDFTNANRGKEIVITVIRGNEERQFRARLRDPGASEQGALGVALGEAGVDRQNPVRAVASGLRAAWSVTTGTVVAFVDLFRNLVFKASVPEGVVGPVGIFGIAQTAGSAGIIPLIQILALISINLAVLNLIPFPALDGGRFLMIIVEKLKGSPISKNIEAAINSIGFLLLIVLMVVITFRDVVHLF